MALTSPKMGLRIWDQLSDPYDHDQLADNFSKIDFHDHSPGRGVQIPTEGIADGAITSGKLAATVFGPGSISTSALADASRLGLTDGSTVRRGAINIPTSQVSSSTSYGLLTTPDRISSVVLPTNGLIFLAYQASWKESVSGAARAGLFLNANPVKRADGTALSNAEAGIAGTATGEVVLFSTPYGLDSPTSAGTSAYFGDATTGQIIGSVVGGTTRPGGVAVMFAAAGTYDVSVQFKVSSGNVTVQNRKLYVWTMGF